MAIALITGSSGLIGSEAARFFHDKGFDIVGVDNNLREYFFGSEGSTLWKKSELERDLQRFRHRELDIRNQEGIEALLREFEKDISVIIHAAAQPSHDWAAKEPYTDFSVNAQGTLVMLESARKYCPSAPFLFTSTNKVYGDAPNNLPLVERESRWELESGHRYSLHGIDESMSIDQSMHSLFGASKVAADVLVQEYGRYFGMNTVSFRGGCLTGPAHSGAELHGFLAYLVKCVVTGKPYTIFGYKGKQVRDNIHSYDLVNALWHFFQAPRPGAVYNMGGSRHSNCSVIEAIRLAEELVGKKMNFSISDQARSGDHIWWISDVLAFKKDYPNWTYKHDFPSMMAEIVDVARTQFQKL